MPDYIVLANCHRVVTREKDGAGEKVTRIKIYKKGDTVSMSPDEAERLVRTGGLRKAGEDSDPTTAGSRLPNSAVPVTTGDRVESPGALSGQVADEGLRDATEPSPEAIEAHQAALAAAKKAREAFHAERGTQGEGDQDSEPDDGYDDLDYPSLQAAAKERNLEHTGKKKEIIARLRAYDADQPDDDDEDDATS